MFTRSDTCMRQAWFGVFFAFVFASAQGDAAASLNWSLRAWQPDEGLPDTAVVGIGQTADGFLWVATQGGLVRFDGFKFTEFPAMTAAGTPTGLMRTLCVDRHNRLWVAKDVSVLACMENGRTTAFTTGDGLPMARAKSMVADGEDNLWVAYSGREIVRVGAGKLTRFGVENGLPGGADCCLAADREGQLWFASEGKLGVFEHENFNVRTNLGSIEGIAAGRAGGLWVCSGRNVLRYLDGKFKTLRQIPGSTRASGPVLLYEDRAGALWAGTSDAGLFRFNGANFESVATTHREILCMMEGREGALWVGTMGGGLNRVQPGIIEVQAITPGTPLEGVRSVCEDIDGALWAVDRNGGVARNRGDGWRTLGDASGWRLTNVTCVVPDQGGGVWVGTWRNGLHLWRDRVVLSLTENEGLGGKVIRSLLPTPERDLWIATTAQTLQRWRAGKLESFSIPTNCGAVRALELDTSGAIWAGTAGGFLLRVKNDVLTTEQLFARGLPQAVRCLRATPEGSLWIGYGGGGVGRFRNGKFTHFRSSEGLNDDYISAILDDSRGRLWLAGNKGIFYVRGDDFNAVAEGRAASVRSVPFGREEGLPVLETSWDFWPGAVRARDGRICLATRAGLAVINAEKFERDPAPPRVVLESVVVDGRQVAGYDTEGTAELESQASLVSLREHLGNITVAPEHQQVSFQFTAPSCATTRGVGFKYRLEGLDDDWVDAGTRRVAYYTHIPPGNYQFHVIACNRDGVWNEAGASVALTAQPHFWERAVFRFAAIASVCALVAVAVVMAMRRRYHGKLEALERQRLVERERARIAQDLHDDLGAGLVEITFSSELMQDASLRLEETRQYTSEIAARAREMVTALDEIVWALNPRHDTVASLATYFCQFAQHFLKPARLPCTLEVAKDLPEAPLTAEQRHSLFLAFKEALTNVVRHAGATHVRLVITGTETEFNLAIIDNGCGIRPSDGSRPGSDGLENMHGRLESVCGKCTVTSQAGAGTTVSFSLPLQARVQPSSF